MEETAALRALAALAQPLRLRAFRALVVAGQAGATPGRIADDLKIAPATLSFHLRELTHAGLVTQERRSRNLVYRADFARMSALLAYLTENCCQADGDADATCAASPSQHVVQRIL
ncbi:MAG: helix-turn-helix transcriptional regulator [Burkholderiales bacterium]|nr:helix-turn-helix transcriptional regulator [Burkholderiales bacterium]